MKHKPTKVILSIVATAAVSAVVALLVWWSLRARLPDLAGPPVDPASVEVNSATASGDIKQSQPLDRMPSVEIGPNIDTTPSNRDPNSAEGGNAAPRAQVESDETAPKVLQLTVPSPLLPWDTDHDTYARLRDDETAPLATRSDAATKSLFRFAEWRGRGVNLLGGYELVPDTVAVLDGWTASDSPSPTPRGKPPVCVERTLQLERQQARLFVKIQVAVSVGWAHQLLLNQKASGSNSMTHESWGDLHGVEVGDVWFGSAKSGFDFARRNVVVTVDYNSGVAYGGRDEFRTLDLMALAREIDHQVQKQGLPGRDWTEISGSCPEVVAFSATTRRLAIDGASSQSQLQIEVRSGSEADAITLLSAAETPLWLEISNQPYRVEVMRVPPDFLDAGPVTVRCWLIAVNTRNLLFTVAEITFTLEKP